jgi:hypothetical protein
MSWKRIALLVMGALAVHLMSWSSAIWSHDGIQLTVARGALPGDVLLTWSGGTEPFQVFRSDEPGNVSDPANLIGQTPTSNWNDAPPPAIIHYYHVTEASEQRAVAKINEVQCEGSSGPEDYLEIYVLEGGSMGGWTIEEWATGDAPAVEHTFDASFSVATGDYIVLHYDSANQWPFAQEDDAGSTKDESMATDAVVTAWDVYTANNSCTSTDNFFLLRSLAGVEDSVAYSNGDGTLSTTMETIFNAVRADASLQWVGFTVEANGTNDAEVQVQCALSGDAVGQSAQRDSDYTSGGGGTVDTDTNAEWCSAANTMGFINLDCP